MSKKYIVFNWKKDPIKKAMEFQDDEYANQLSAARTEQLLQHLSTF